MMKRILLGVLALGLVAITPARSADLAVDGNLRLLCGVVTGSSNASTLANKCGVVTTETSTAAAGATFLETITNSVVAATDVCISSVTTTGAGTPVVTKVTPAAGSLAITIQNVHASAAFDAALKIAFICFKAAA